MIKPIIGHLYQNKWGDIKVPIAIEENDVIFIHKNGDNLPFLYNPYSGQVSIASFMKNFSDKKIKNPLSEEEVKKILLTIKKKDREWEELLRSAAVEIFEVLQNKDLK